MKKSEITITENILIAKFLGMTETKADNLVDKRKKPFVVYRKKDLKFHKNWDSLMPALDKIQELGFNIITRRTASGTGVLIKSNDGLKVVSISLTDDISFSLEITRKAVLDFIKWYKK